SCNNPMPMTTAWAWRAAMRELPTRTSARCSPSDQGSSQTPVANPATRRPQPRCRFQDLSTTGQLPFFWDSRGSALLDVPRAIALPDEDSDDNFATLAGHGGEVAPVIQHLGSKGVTPVRWPTSPLRHRLGPAAAVGS